MKRRGFLAALIGSAVLDPERLLWVPGKKVISIPKPAPRKYYWAIMVPVPGAPGFCQVNWEATNRAYALMDIKLGTA